MSLLQETINLVNKLQQTEQQAQSFPQMQADKEKAEEQVVNLTVGLSEWSRRFKGYEEEILLWESWLKECQDELKSIKGAKATKAHIKKILEVINKAFYPDPEVVAQTRKEQNTPKA